MSKIILSCDTPADLSPELYEKLGIKTISMGVSNIFEKGDIHKDTNITINDLYKAFDSGLVPKTSAGLETDYYQLFESADGTPVIHFSISDKLSASHQNAKRAAAGFENIFIVDSKTLSVGIGALVMRAHELIEAGESAEVIYEKMIEMREKLDVSFIINDLNYLYKGGRVSGLKLLGANLLKIRPSLYMDSEGRLVPGKKYKGQFKKCVQEFIADKLLANQNSDKTLSFVAHSTMDDETIPIMAVSELSNYGFAVTHLPVGATITIHCGKNTFGMVFVRD